MFFSSQYVMMAFDNKTRKAEKIVSVSAEKWKKKVLLAEMKGKKKYYKKCAFCLMELSETLSERLLLRYMVGMQI